MKRIESSSNPVFRELLALGASARDRRRLGLSVIEGAHLLGAFAARYGAPHRLFVPERTMAALGSIGDEPGGGAQASSSTAITEIGTLLRTLGVEPIVLADRLFTQASQVENGPGPIAIVATPRPALPERLTEDAVYLDRVQDPGNVGSILRTCAAVGIRRLIASPGTAFCWSPKVLRAAMGAHFHVDIHEGVTAAELLPRLAVQAMATAADAPLSLYDADLRAPRIWLLGNEGQGLEPALRAAPAVCRVSIPQSEAVESLNVGVAGAVCLYEQLRQRRAAR